MYSVILVLALTSPAEATSNGRGVAGSRGAFFPRDGSFNRFPFNRGIPVANFRFLPGFPGYASSYGTSYGYSAASYGYGIGAASYAAPQVFAAPAPALVEETVVTRRYVAEAAQTYAAPQPTYQGTGCPQGLTLGASMGAYLATLSEAQRVGYLESRYGARYGRGVGQHIHRHWFPGGRFRGR